MKLYLERFRRCVLLPAVVVLLTLSFSLMASRQARSESVDEKLAHEKSLIALFPKIAQRQNSLLTVNFKTGEHHIFRSTCNFDVWEYGCEGRFLVDYDPRRDVMTIERARDEYHDYYIIDLVSGSIIVVDEILIAAPGQRAWAGVDDGIGPFSSRGEILWVDQIEGKFRRAGDIQKPYCRFTRWEETQLAFVVFCEDGEFRVTLDSEGHPKLSPTGRKTTEDEWWSSN